MKRYFLFLIMSIFLLTGCGAEASMDADADSIADASGDANVDVAGNSDAGTEATDSSDTDVDAGISTLPLGIYLEVVDVSDDGIITLNIINDSGYQMTYGNEYYLQLLDDDEWIDVEPVKDYGWTDEAIIIDDLTQRELKYDLSVFGELKAGHYKILKTDLEAEFDYPFDGK